jgi:hypothetical protein
VSVGDRHIAVGVVGAAAGAARHTTHLAAGGSVVDHASSHGGWHQVDTEKSPVRRKGRVLVGDCADVGERKTAFAAARRATAALRQVRLMKSNERQNE